MHRKFIFKSKSYAEEVIKEREVVLLAFLQALVDIIQTANSPDIQILSFLGMLNTSYELDHIKEKSSIHISKLTSIAKPGDILFFKCHGGLQQLQRVATGSEYDHVALVVKGSKLNNGELSILESTGEGVTAYALQARLEAYDYWKRCSYITIRRLESSNSNGDDQFNFITTNIDTFLDQVIGKPYKFKVSDIFQSKYNKTASSSPSSSILRTSLQMLSNQDESFNRISESFDTTKTSDTNEVSSTYFCSQLVADCLKQLEIIDNEMNSKAFWPGSFATGDLIDRIAINGYKYSDEIVINFKTLELSEARVCSNSKAPLNSKLYYQEGKPKETHNQDVSRVTSTFTITM